MDGVDPAFAALLADPRMALRRPPLGIPVAVVRAGVNRFMARAAGPPIHQVCDSVMDGAAGLLRLRVYRPSAEPEMPVILFCHGGGFMFGDLDTHDGMCRALALAAGAAVVAVDYRQAPEHAFPAAFDDCRAALRWIDSHAVLLGFDARRVAVAGDSAGGQLAAAVALDAVSGGQQISHAALLYPLLDPARSSASAHAFAEGYVLTDSFITWAWEAYGAEADLNDPRYNLTHAALAGFPTATIVTAAMDPLRDEGASFADRLHAADVAVELRCYRGMIHGFAGMPQLTQAAGAAISFIGQRIGASFSASQ